MYHLEKFQIEPSGIGDTVSIAIVHFLFHPRAISHLNDFRAGGVGGAG